MFLSVACSTGIFRAQEIYIDISGCKYSQPFGQAVAVGVERAKDLDLVVKVCGFSTEWPDSGLFAKYSYPT